MDNKEEKMVFDWIEYSVCAVMIGLSALIGVYYAFCSKQDTVSEYFLGGKKMSTFPIVLSLIASHISCISILGVPVEIFTYGGTFMVGAPSCALAVVIVMYGFMPVFYNLNIISVNEYLELRFSKAVRKMASVLFCILLIFYTPVIIYTVSLALEEVSDVNLFIVALAVSVICTFYTTVGGLKAVVWTDTLQGLITILSIVVVSVLGTSKVGGVQKLVEINKEGKIFDLNLSLSPFDRITVWTNLFGSVCFLVAHFGIHAGSVQRFASLPTIRHARWSVVYMACGTTFIFLVCGYLGLVLYGVYHDCNPYMAKRIKRRDQMLSFLIMNIGGSIKGLPGLFIAGIFSAALGTMSASLNTMAGIIYEDFLVQFLSKETSDKKASNIMKILAAVLGAICLSLVFFVNKLKGLIQIANSFSGISIGSSLGIFILGMFFPSANKKGALCGGISGLAFMTWIIFGNQLSLMQGQIKYQTIPSSIDNCPYNVTIGHNSTISSDNNEEVFYLFRISFVLYTFVGSIVTIIVGLIVSFITGPTKPKDINQDLISPLVRQFYYKTKNPVEKEMYIIVKQTENETKESM